MASQPNITLPEKILVAVQEAAEREHKSLDDMAGELILRGLRKQRQGTLEELMEYGEQRSREFYPEGLTEERVVDIVHSHRQSRRR